MLMFTIIVTFLLATATSRYSGDKCQAAGQTGTCTELSQCQPLQNEIRSTGNILTLSMRVKLQQINCGYNKFEPLVCCVDNDSDLGFRADINSNVGPPDVNGHPNLNKLPKDCGSMEVVRISGGNKTALYEMPWMVLLSYNTPKGKVQICGGTLINEWYVLTAAHCVVDQSDMQLDSVILGEWDTRTDPDCEPPQEKGSKNKTCAPRNKDVGIASVISYPGYSRQTLFDDIALIRLAEPADFTLASMAPICLPMTRELQRQDLVNQTGVVAGWGMTEFGLQSPVLLSVGLPIIGNKDCQQAFHGSPRIDDKQMCAVGEAGTDSCAGDSGGPLMFPGICRKGGIKYVQRGIVSYGARTCGRRTPGVYTRLAYYMDWILNNIS